MHTHTHTQVNEKNTSYICSAHAVNQDIIVVVNDVYKIS